MTLSHRQKLTIIPLLFYWPTIFILAHIPIPQLVRRARVSDKSLHYIAYLILIFLLWFAVGPDRKVNWRRAAVWWVLFVVTGYSFVDEWLQYYVAGRSRSIMDFSANLAGMLTGLVLFSFFTFWPALLVVTGMSIFLLTNLARTNLADLLPLTNAAFHLFAYGIFTMLWIRHINHLSDLKLAKHGRLVAELALPLGLLFAVKLFSVVSGRYFVVWDIIIASVAITAVVVINYSAGCLTALVNLFRQNSA